MKVERIIFAFLQYRRSTLSEQAISEIGPIEKNPVVEQNSKNTSFMRAWEECVFIADRLFGFAAVVPERDIDISNLTNEPRNDAKISIDNNDLGNESAITYSSMRLESSKANIVSSDQPRTSIATIANSSKCNNEVDDDLDRNAVIANSKYPIIVLSEITHKFAKQNKTDPPKNPPPVNAIEPRMTRAKKRKMVAQSTNRMQPKSKENVALDATEPRCTRATKRKMNAQAAYGEQPRIKKSKQNEFGMKM